MDWSKYAQVYDFMSENNPAYQQLIIEMRVASVGALATLDGEEFSILDIGAGTGNLTVQLASTFPKATVIHVDPDDEMLHRAKEKAAALDISNIEFLKSKAEDLHFADQSFDLVTSMHSLYAISDPSDLIRKVAGWLRSGGSAVMCDFGRVMNTTDWSKYLLKSWHRKYGFFRTAILGARALSVRSSNNEISKKQKSGEYWTHGLEEFEGLFREAGLRVVSSSETYRGFSDLVVAGKQAEAFNSDVALRETRAEHAADRKASVEATEEV